MRNFKSVCKMICKPRNLQAFLMVAFSLFLAAPLYAQQTYSLNDDLFYRINFGRVEDVSALLEKGANPNAVSSSGESALTVAIGRDDTESVRIVKALLDKGADPNAYDKSNLYPIVSAAINNKTETVADLLAKGADYRVKSPNGRTLIEIATANKNQDVINLIQSKVAHEAEEAAKLRTPERFRDLVKQYVFDSCAYQYWSYIYGSRQYPDKDQENTIHIERTKADVSTLVEQIQKYYPTTPVSDLQRVSSGASKDIYDTLQGMVSNTNRSALGVGTQTDLDTRCHRISEAVKIDFPPNVTK